MGYSAPEEVGISSERLVGINAIAETAVDKGVFPGCQIVVAKEGKVIFSKSFGSHTYSKKKPVKNTDLYDIASVTKIAATTLSVMKLSETGKVSLKGEVGDYLLLNENATVKKIEIRDLLLHRSGLQAQMPIARYLSWRNVPSKGCNKFFCRKFQKGFGVQVANGLFLESSQPDSIWSKVYRLPVFSRKNYVYSDVNFFLLQKVVETISQKTLDDYVFENFYLPLGLRRTAFHPLEKYGTAEIVPTENDRIWRKTLVHGFVHDPSAALMGGVGGSAGVFASAEDLAVLFQMLLNGGSYGGIQYLKPETVETFTSSPAGNFRALGFDKPVNRRYPTYSPAISSTAFGHTGFTGTCIWADPKNNVVYVFLSNRVHPTSTNSKIFTEGVRGRIHDIVYDAFDTFQIELPELNLQAETVESK
jgi:CubicO group peptidase (beta-lactamase class C family)